MAPDIHTVAFVADGARNSPHLFALFQHNRLDIGSFDQFKRRSESRGASAYNHRSLFWHQGYDAMKILLLNRQDRPVRTAVVRVAAITAFRIAGFPLKAYRKPARQ